MSKLGFEYMRQGGQSHALQTVRVGFSPLVAAGRSDARLLELLASVARPSPPPKRDLPRSYGGMNPARAPPVARGA